MNEFIQFIISGILISCGLTLFFASILYLATLDRSFKIIVNDCVYMNGVSEDRLFIPRPQPSFVRNIQNFEIVEENFMDKILNFFRGV